MGECDECGQAFTLEALNFVRIPMHQGRSFCEPCASTLTSRVIRSREFGLSLLKAFDKKKKEKEEQDGNV